MDRFPRTDDRDPYEGADAQRVMSRVAVVFGLAPAGRLGRRAEPDPTSDRLSFPVCKCRDPPTSSAAHFFVIRFLTMVSEDQIQQWADEAEAGYDVEEIKRRGRGRPGRGAEPMRA